MTNLDDGLRTHLVEEYHLADRTKCCSQLVNDLPLGDRVTLLESIVTCRGTMVASLIEAARRES